MIQLIKFANKSFTLPDTCIKVRTVLDDPTSSIDDIAQIISVDPSLSAKVLKLANSALFRFPEQVTNVNKALGVIGGEAAYNITMAETANLAFKAMSNIEIDFNVFWEKSVQQGLIAQSIAQQIQSRGSERFFVMGILMSFSELICATKFPQKYQDYCLLKATHLPLEAQKKIFGFTFCHCSGRILESFHLPTNLYESLISLTLYAQQQLSQDESILYIASVMAEKQLGQELLLNKDFNLQAVQSIGLNDYEYDIILQFAQKETKKIAQAIN